MSDSVEIEFTRALRRLQARLGQTHCVVGVLAVLTNGGYSASVDIVPVPVPAAAAKLESWGLGDAFGRVFVYDDTLLRVSGAQGEQVVAEDPAGEVWRLSPEVVRTALTGADA